MNVSFHTLAALATVATIAPKAESTGHTDTCGDLPKLTCGVLTGIMTHGVLDLLPHTYPLPSKTDVAIALVVLLMAAIRIAARHRVLMMACFLGAVLPDFIDLGPAQLNRLFGWSLPVIKFFPWHWPEYSGSIFTGERGAESALSHLLVAAAGFLFLARRWRRLSV